MADIRFPEPPALIRCICAPILIEPLQGSEERLAIGVVVISGKDSTVVYASGLEKLSCLFGDEAEALILSSRANLHAMSDDVMRRGHDALEKPNFPFQGAYIGNVEQVVGRSVDEVGERWMRSFGSLWQPRNQYISQMAPETSYAMAKKDDYDIGELQTKDRLPRLVYDYIIERNQSVATRFRSVIQVGHSARQPASRTVIDFAGSKIVANIGTLRSRQRSQSVLILTKKLWDLVVNREKQGGLFTDATQYELLVHVPKDNDPEYTPRQIGNIKGDLEALTEQADREKLRLRGMTSVDEIGDHILKAEVA